MNKIIFLLLFFLTAGIMACKKYLDTKPDKSFATPNSIEAVQGILDYSYLMNTQSAESGEIASDNYYLTDEVFNALYTDRMRNAYLWQPGGADPYDWQNEYTVVYNANIVLDNLPSIERNAANAKSWDQCKGQALLFRAKAFFEIAQIWTKAYDFNTASKDLGIPLRLTADFNVPSVRSDLKATYEQIITDIKQAIPLLPQQPVFVFRPSKPAGYGLLSRVCLVMGDYNNAAVYADSCLRLKNELLDYNTLDTTIDYPFSGMQYENPEDIWHYSSGGGINPSLYYGKVDTILYNLYENNDLRKTIFYTRTEDGAYNFTGSYDGYSLYCGITTAEMYITRAECLARNGKAEEATALLNQLLAKRIREGTFISVTETDPKELLRSILDERRKELVFRMLRFSDIKRLNREGAGIVLRRYINGKEIILQPNDPKYALPIPEEVITATGMPQN